MPRDIVATIHYFGYIQDMMKHKACFFVLVNVSPGKFDSGTVGQIIFSLFIFLKHTDKRCNQLKMTENTCEGAQGCLSCSSSSLHLMFLHSVPLPVADAGHPKT